MKFYTNRISTAKAKSFDDIVKEYQEKQKKEEVKMASARTAVKTAEEAEEAESSGQLDVEPLHQEGESTTMPKAGPSAKKEDNEGGKSGKAAKADTDPEKEGEDSGQPKAEGSEKLTNDPKVLEDAKGGSTQQKTKTAGSTCQECGQPCDKCKCTNCKCASCTEAKKTAALEDLPEEVQNKIKGKKDEDTEEKEAEVEDKDEEEKEAETDTEEKAEEKKEASVKFVKIANLNEKNKNFLRTYWTKLYGADYVNAMLADK